MQCYIVDFNDGNYMHDLDTSQHKRTNHNDSELVAAKLGLL